MGLLLPTGSVNPGGGRISVLDESCLGWAVCFLQLRGDAQGLWEGGGLVAPRPPQRLEGI